MKKTENLTKINFALCLLIIVIMALGVGLAFSGEGNSFGEHSGVGASAQQASIKGAIGSSDLQGVALAERTLTLAEKTAVFTGAPIVANTAIPSAGGGEITYEYFDSAIGGTSVGRSLGATAPTNVGVYWAQASIAADTTYVAVKSAQVKLTITQATVTLNFAAEAYDIPYKGAVVGIEGEHLATVNLVGNVAVTGVITYEFYPNANCVPTELIGAPENIGVYYVKAKLSGDTNYADVTSDTYKTITVTAVDITTFKFDTITDIPYNGVGVNVSNCLKIVGMNGKAPTGVITYKYYANVANNGDTQGTLLTAIPTAVGIYWVEAEIAADGNYKAKTSPAIKFSVVQGTLSAKTAPTASVIYIPQVVGDSVITAGVIHNADGVVAAGTYAWKDGTAKPSATGIYTKNIIVFTPENVNYKALEIIGVVLTVEQLKLNFSGENGVVTNNTALTNGANVDYGASVIFTATANVGYTFSKWTLNGVDGGVETTLTISITDKNNTVVGVCVANTNTAYVVNHKLQNLNDPTGYTQTKQDTLTGMTGASITIVPNVYEGFTAPTTGLTYIIKADGSLVIDLLYKRNKYRITADGGAAMQKEFGDIVHLTPREENGYTFGGWTNNQDVQMTNNEYVVIAKDIVFTSIMNLKPADVVIASVGSSKIYDGVVVMLTANHTHILTTGLTYSYAWYKGEALIAGETNKTLTLVGDVADSATYKVIVTSTVTASGKTSTAEKTQVIAIAKKDVSIAVINYANIVVKDGENIIAIAADGTIKQVTINNVPEGVTVKCFADSAHTIPFEGVKFGSQKLYIKYVADANHNIIDINTVNELTFDVQGFIIDIIWNIQPTYTYSGKVLTGISAKYIDRNGKEIILALGAGMKFTQNGKEVPFQNAGVYNVTIDIGGCMPNAVSTTTQTIVIQQRNIDISNMKFLDMKKMFTGQEFTFTVGGILDENVMVEYFNEDGSPFVSLKDVGTYLIKAVFSPKDAKNYKISGINNNTLTATISIAYDVRLENAFTSSVERIGVVDANSFNAIKLAIIQYIRLPYTGNVTEAKAILDTKIAEYNAIITATNDCMDEAQTASRKMFDGVAAAVSSLAAAYVVCKFRLV